MEPHRRRDDIVRARGGGERWWGRIELRGDCLRFEIDLVWLGGFGSGSGLGGDVCWQSCVE